MVLLSSGLMVIVAKEQASVLDDIIIQKIRFLFNRDIQEREERCGWKSDDTVIIAFNFSYQKAAKSLDSKSTGSVYAFTAIDVGFHEMFWIQWI